MLSSDQIKPRIDAIRAAVLAANPTQKPGDAAALTALAELLTSTMEAIHDAAFYLQNLDDRERNRGQ